jgi:hypothetical protein
MVNTAEAEVAFVATNSAYAFDVMTLPRGAVIVGGNVIVEDAFTTGGSATVSVGTSSDPDVYSNNTTITLETAGITAITPEAANGGVVTADTDVRLTFAISNNAVSTGKARVNILYVIEGRTTEVTARS